MNTGTWPIDPATSTGLFRFEVGDVVGTPNVPADGQATFEFISDSAIDALLLAYPDRGTAKSRALMSMATQLIASAQDIQVDDIRIKTVERANLMLTLATTLGEGASMGEAASAFTIVGLTPATNYFPRTPQGIPGHHNYGESGF